MEKYKNMKCRLSLFPAGLPLITWEANWVGAFEFMKFAKLMFKLSFVKLYYQMRPRRIFSIKNMLNFKDYLQLD